MERLTLLADDREGGVTERDAAIPFLCNLAKKIGGRFAATRYARMAAGD